MDTFSAPSVFILTPESHWKCQPVGLLGQNGFEIPERLRHDHRYPVIRGPLAGADRAALWRSLR